jgi:hypothetical protein
VHVAVLPAPNTAVPLEKEPSTFINGIAEKQLIHNALRCGEALYPPSVYVQIGLVSITLQAGTLIQAPAVPEAVRAQLARVELLST